MIVKMLLNRFLYYIRLIYLIVLKMDGYQLLKKTLWTHSINLLFF